MESTTAPAAPEQQAQLWEDFIDIFYAPTAVFDRRRAGRFALALALLTILMTVLFYASQTVLADATRADFVRALGDQELPPEQLEMMGRMAGMFGTVSFLITFPIGVILIAALLWLAGKPLGSTATFAAAAMVATYSQAPRLLQQLVSVLQGMMMDSVSTLYHVTLSPARFLDPDTTSAVVMGLLSRFDVFTVWATVLLAIGLSVVGAIPRSRAALAAGAVWITGALPLLTSAL